jgi:hypothetical protein
LINNTFRISVPNPPFSLPVGEPDKDTGEDEIGECGWGWFRVDGMSMGAKIRPVIHTILKRGWMPFYNVPSPSEENVGEPT